MSIARKKRNKKFCGTSKIIERTVLEPVPEKKRNKGISLAQYLNDNPIEEGKIRAVNFEDFMSIDFTT